MLSDQLMYFRSKNIQDAHDGSYAIERKHFGEINDDFTNRRSLDDGYLKFHHKRDTQRNRSPYGLVYNQGVPIGILQVQSDSKFQIPNVSFCLAHTTVVSNFQL